MPRGGLSTESTLAAVDPLEGRRLLSTTLTTLLTFGPGQFEPSAITSDAAGNLYTTTNSVSNNNNVGSVLKLAAGSHAVSTLASSTGGNLAPGVALLHDGAGDLYGWNYSFPDFDPTIGEVFKLAAGSHKLTPLVNLNPAGLSGPGTDAPGDLILDARGDLFGTTTTRVFEVAASTHAFTSLIRFDPGREVNPGGLVCDAAGDLFGTTEGDGIASGGNDGTIFEVPAGTHKVVTIATFNGNNGGAPSTNLLCDHAGDVFGATDGGGTNGDGTVFEITAGKHKLKTIAASDGSNGPNPNNLLMGPGGELYGSTAYATATAVSTIFEASPTTGSLTTLATFGGSALASAVSS